MKAVMRNEPGKEVSIPDMIYCLEKRSYGPYR
jgi:hypothetical protein